MIDIDEIYSDIHSYQNCYTNMNSEVWSLSMMMMTTMMMIITTMMMTRGWAKQKSENSGLFRNLLNGFWLPYCHVQLVLFLCRIFSLNIFCMLLSFDRVHFRISCIIWNRCPEVKSQYWHHQNFSPTSIHCIQRFECLLQEAGFKIMISVSVFVFWNISRK